MKTANEATLRYLYVNKDLTQREIAEKLDLTQGCISKKMKEFGIESDHTGFWSENEEQKLERNYNECSKEEIRSMLPNRSWEAIKLKAMELGVATPIEEHRHSDEVRERLQRNTEQNMIKADYDRKEEVSYILGVVDGDGFHDKKGTIGLEVKFSGFADKFEESLKNVGFNPGRGKRRGKETVWASSTEFVKWMSRFNWKTKFRWLKEEGEVWRYIEGAYDSDGDFSNVSPRICSYDIEEKKFLHKILTEILGLEASIQQNNVYIKASSREKFFENVDPVYDKRRP